MGLPAIELALEDRFELLNFLQKNSLHSNLPEIELQLLA